MGMFDFFSMANNYEERKVERFERDKLVIDTCRVTDSEKDYETGIIHPKYNDGEWVIVQLYDTKTQSKRGHKKWVGKMTARALPKQLKDVSTCEVAFMIDSVSEDEDWRTIEKTKK